MTFYGQQMTPSAADLANPMVDLSNTRAPIYVQLSTLFRRFIVRGQWPVGNQIPTHDALAMQFGVNPATIRKAIDTLEVEGLIECSRRRGSFVIAKPANAEWYEIASTWKNALHAYDRLTFEMLEAGEASELPAGSHTGGSAARDYVRMRRLYRRGTFPLVVEDSCLDRTIYKKIGRSALRNAGLAALVDRNARVKRAEQIFRFGIADGEMSKPLDVPLNAPLAIVHLSIFGDGSAPLFESIAYFRGDMIRIVEPIKFSKKRE